VRQLPKWFYNENQQVGTDYTDIKEVQLYDQRMERIRDIEKEVEDVKDAVNPRPNHSILEIGTGTGELAIALSEHCGRVYAVDTSLTMLEAARKKAQIRKRTNIEFLCGGFLSYQHQGRPLDAVISQLALHHLPDFWKLLALKSIYSLLQPGGILYLRDVVFPSIANYYSYFSELIEEMRVSAGEIIAAEFETHIREEFSTLDWIMEGLLQSAGFKIKNTANESSFLACYVCEK